jgi:hypothetical protein
LGSRILMVAIASLLCSTTAHAEIETKLVCGEAGCDFVLLGGTTADRSLTLRPNSADPRSGRLRLDGFTDLFPDWRPPSQKDLDVLFSWSPTARLPVDSSVRLFEAAPNLTVTDSTGSALFAVTGSLTRTGNLNPLYQWTGFYFGTHFMSAATAICTGGGNVGSTCTTDEGCRGGRCEGGSPLYQDAFYDGSLAEQRRGHAIQHTWIPISFLTKAALKASKSCVGGSNDDGWCKSDAQCPGGSCRAGYLDQNAFYGFYAQPSFQEEAGATLIDRDYAAVVVDNPWVAGSPQVDRFTGMLCDPQATDWSRLPDGTTKSCLVSLGPNITSRHVGAFRIGDARVPSDKLEVNGTLSLDTGGDGTINGSKTPGAGLRLNANNSPSSPGAVRVGSVFTSVPDGGWTLLLNENELDLASAKSRVIFSDFAGRWTFSADGAADSGFVGSRFRAVVSGSPGTASRSAGGFVQQVMAPRFVVADDPSVQRETFSVDRVVGVDMEPSLARSAVSSDGRVAVEESTTVRDAPDIEAGGAIGTRRGLSLLDKHGDGAQGTVVGVDVADQTVTTYAAAVRSEMSHGEGKWHLALRGTADSSIGGSVIVGPSQETVPQARLHVEEQRPNAEVVRIETATEGDHPALRMFQQRATTSDAAPATLQEFATERDHSYLIEARIVARCVDEVRCPSGQSAAYVRRVLAQNARGKLTCVGQAGGPGDFAAETDPAWDAGITCEGSAVRVRVSGAESTKITWHDTLMVEGLSS